LFLLSFLSEVIMRVLVLNSGSSSVKFAVIDTHSKEEIASGIIESIGSETSAVTTKLKNGEKQKSARAIKTIKDAFAVIQEFLRAQNLDASIEAIGHRVVHGGKYFKSQKITAEVKEYLTSIELFAPLHQPAHVAGFENAAVFFPKLTQVAVFDTAFHQTMPRKAFLYGIPYKYYEDLQIRRYGFHGTSHYYLTQEAAKRLKIPVEEINLVTAHLGNGSSASAIRNGKCADTTMGFTPLEGLVMGTRSGSLDPAILFFLHDKLGYDMKRLDKLLNKESGLFGLSGSASDMRAILEKRAAGDERAAIAFEVFCYRLAREIGGIVMALPRLDALVFSGGIGENSAEVRKQTLENLALLGFKTDEARNEIHGKNTNGVISAEGTPLAIVIPTNEELVIAFETEKVVAG
jgi:acetate kinase